MDFDLNFDPNPIPLPHLPDLNELAQDEDDRGARQQFDCAGMFHNVFVL